jgi:hypothetical protein
MTARQFAQLLIQLWAISMLVRVLTLIPTHLLVLFDADAPPGGGAALRAAQMGGIASLALTVVAAVILLVYAPAIAARVAGEDAPLGITITAQQLFVVAVSLLALYFLVAGAQALAMSAYALAAKPSWDQTGNFEYIWARHQETIAAALVQLAAGIALFRQRRAFAERL